MNVAQLKREGVRLKLRVDLEGFHIHMNVAQLKHTRAVLLFRRRLWFPHSYECGSIEAYFEQAQPAVRPRFPHSYECGSIEAAHPRYAPPGTNRVSTFI